MEDLEMTKIKKTEYEKEKFSTVEEVTEARCNRKHVNAIKRFLIGVFIVACSLPVYLGLYMVVKMNEAQGNVSNAGDEKIYIEYSDMQNTSAKLRADISENYALLDADTSGDLDKISVQGNEHLMNPAGSAMQEDKVVSNGRTVYLTFDDGPSENTQQILDILAANNVKAAFFTVCNPEQSLWPLYKEIVEQGHTLAMHSYSHEYGTVYASEESFEEDVTKIHDFLYEQTGVDCKLYRFPGGSSNSVSNVDIQKLIKYLNNKDITYFDWNSLSGDAVDPSLPADQLNANIMGYVRNNSGDSVILMHDIDACDETVNGLQTLIDTLKKEGYAIKAIDQNTVPVQHVTYTEEP